MKMVKKGIVDIDIYKSMMHKDNKDQHIVEQIFGDYHSLVEKTFNEYQGESWHTMGDGSIYIFPSSTRAVEACIQLLENLVTFNKENENKLSGFPLFTRIGIHEIDNDIANVPENERGMFAHQALDIAGKLQKNCPVGKIAISIEVYQNLGNRRCLFRPSLIEFSGRRFFILADRMITPQEEELLDGLTKKQKLVLPPIFSLSWEKIKPDENLNLITLDRFFRQQFTIVLGETSPDLKGRFLLPQLVTR